MAGLNPITEDIHPDDDAVTKRQAKGYPPPKPVIDQYAQYLHLEMWMESSATDPPGGAAREGEA